MKGLARVGPPAEHEPNQPIEAREDGGRISFQLAVPDRQNLVPKPET